jgi:hypothetical protein
MKDILGWIGFTFFCVLVIAMFLWGMGVGN